MTLEKWALKQVQLITYLQHSPPLGPERTSDKNTVQRSRASLYLLGEEWQESSLQRTGQVCTKTFSFKVYKSA